MKKLSPASMLLVVFSLLSASVIWLLGPILTPFLIGAFFAYALNPCVCAMERVGLSRTIASVLTVLMMIMAVVMAASLVLPLLESEVVALIRAIPEMTQKLVQTLQPRIEQLISYLPPREIDSANDFLRTSIISVGHWFVERLGDFFRNSTALASIISLVVIGPLVTFYLLRDWAKALLNIQLLLPRQYLPQALGLFRTINEALAGYARGQALVCLIMVAFYGIGLWLCHAKFALVIGLLSGLLTFVPYLGVIIGYSLTIITGLTQSGDFSSLLWVSAVFGAGLAFEGYILTPRFVGGRIGLHPLWIIFAILAGAQLFGVMGILFALPAAAVLRILILEGLARYQQSAVFLSKK